VELARSLAHANQAECRGIRGQDSILVKAPAIIRDLDDGPLLAHG